MEVWIAVLAGILMALSVYLLLSRWAIRMVLGIFILGNATHLLIFVSGRLTRETPPLIEAGAKVAAPGIANPVPQALILTAIVISFSLFTFLLVLVHR
ncbi:MAG: NADH-quinone oxidoreductase subunit K, partial [Myxococcota bacterium]